MGSIDKALPHAGFYPANILEEKSSFPRYFQTFRPFLSLFPIYFLLLQMNMGKCLSGGACATFVE